MQTDHYMKPLVDKIGHDDYDKKVETMKTLKKKEDIDGKFHSIPDILDRRTQE